MGIQPRYTLQQVPGAGRVFAGGRVDSGDEIGRARVRECPQAREHRRLVADQGDIRGPAAPSLSSTARYDGNWP